MRVATGRWGEVTIKKQGERKNNFDSTKSFSIDSSKYDYNIEEFRELFQLVVNISEHYSFEQVKEELLKLNSTGKKGGGVSNEKILKV
jgi:hypothetical protein